MATSRWPRRTCNRASARRESASPGARFREAVAQDAKLPIETQHLMAHIGEAMQSVKAQNPGLEGKALISAIVHANVLQAMHDLVLHGPIIREHMRTGHLKLVGGVYHIETGKVSWLGPHPQERQLMAAAH